MSLLRRLFGGTDRSGGTGGAGGSSGPGGINGSGPAPSEGSGGPTPDAAEAERERDLLRDEARRLSDELLQRQLRYADRSWTPPAQGGEKRASLESTSGTDH